MISRYQLSETPPHSRSRWVLSRWQDPTVEPPHAHFGVAVLCSALCICFATCRCVYFPDTTTDHTRDDATDHTTDHKGLQLQLRLQVVQATAEPALGQRQLVAALLCLDHADARRKISRSARQNARQPPRSLGSGAQVHPGRETPAQYNIPGTDLRHLLSIGVIFLPCSLSQRSCGEAASFFSFSRPQFAR